jgi:hypothetical protein
MRLGVPWIDAGVLADGLLARISAFNPSPDAPCLECAWDASDYAALEQTYPCGSAEPEPPRTNAPSSLGALAAALQAMECAHVLAGEVHSFGSVAELVIGTSPHCHYRTAHRRNPACRLGSHAAWTIEPLALHASCTLRGLRDTVINRVGSPDSLTLGIGGKWFVRTLNCSTCGTTRPTLRLSSSARGALPRCKRCSNPMMVSGLGITEHLDMAALSARDLGRSCAAVGIRTGEVITVMTPMSRGGAEERRDQWYSELHFELVGESRHRTAPIDSGATAEALA